MTQQEMVDRFARLAKPRLLELLRLKVPHIYDDTPGGANSTSLFEKGEVKLKLARTVQPYASIRRFAEDDKLMGFVINPGLVPLVKAITLEVRGRQLLVTRRIADRVGERGVVAHMDGFGVRLHMFGAEDSEETQLVWETLYGVV